jgi:hypothetical protein
MFLTTLVVAIAGAAVVVPAFAGNIVKIDSRVKIKKTSPVFAGVVRSPNNACEINRKVKLYVVEADDVVGTDRTNARGHWKIEFQGEGVAHYYAKVIRHGEGAAGTTFICKRDKSPIVEAP